MGNTDLYLRALALRHKFAEEPIREAVALLEQALALSPADAPAAAMIAWLWVHQVGVWHAVSDAEITEALLLAGSEVFADCCRREGAGRGSGRLRGRRVRSICRSPVWEKIASPLIDYRGGPPVFGAQMGPNPEARLIAS